MELKAIDDLYERRIRNGSDPYKIKLVDVRHPPVYLKSEADKVISELKDKCQMHDFFWEGCGFKKLGFKNSIDVRDYCDALKRQNEDLLQKCRKANKELRHHKYRRCLAVARRCHSESLWWYSKGYGFEKYDKFWEKWEKRWLELAEKFKEATNG